jgi:hypothetical protein
MRLVFLLLAQVPLANEGGAVASGTERLGERRLFGLHLQCEWSFLKTLSLRCSAWGCTRDWPHSRPRPRVRAGASAWQCARPAQRRTTRRSWERAADRRWRRCPSGRRVEYAWMNPDGVICVRIEWLRCTTWSGAGNVRRTAHESRAIQAGAQAADSPAAVAS